MSAPSGVVMDLAFGDYDSWKPSFYTTYRAAAMTLLAHGLSEQEAADLLSNCHAATSEEFGS